MVRRLIAVMIAASALLACEADSGGSRLDPLPGLSTYVEMRTGGVRDVFIHSPWEPAEFLSLGFPEHCWGGGGGLPNTSHDSREPMASPWRFNADSTAGWYENIPKPGVIYRARVEADSMAVRLIATIVNGTDEPITDIRSLVCMKPDSHNGAPKRPDAIAGFRDTSFSRTWIFVDGRPVRLGEETTYHGDIPDRDWAEHEIRSRINWGVNIKGGLDNRTINDIGWFRGNSPGRIVDEVADPAVIAIGDKDHADRWLATIWSPSRVLFSNPQNPCFHSDPSIPDCPPRDSVTVNGMVFFHQGSLDGLLGRVESWQAEMQNSR